jgi:hypothetical protein
MHDTFENAAILIGIPLLAIGAGGVVPAFGAMFSYWLKPS